MSTGWLCILTEVNTLLLSRRSRSSISLLWSLVGRLLDWLLFWLMRGDSLSGVLFISKVFCLVSEGLKFLTSESSLLIHFIQNMYDFDGKIITNCEQVTSTLCLCCTNCHSFTYPCHPFPHCCHSPDPAGCCYQWCCHRHGD